MASGAVEYTKEKVSDMAGKVADKTEKDPESKMRDAKHDIAETVAEKTK